MLKPPSATDASGLPWLVFICRACGLLYDEGEGDADSGLAAGTRFADIPADWACPLCGVTKADFELYVSEPAIRQTRSGVARLQAPRNRRAGGCVIVGAGRAGWQMATALRALDAAMPITLVTTCNGDVYDKPLLSVAMARGLATSQLPRESGTDAAKRLNLTLLAHTEAVSITAPSRQLRTSRGTLPYQHLVLAHGAQAKALPQLPDALCWRINHLQAYAQFRSALGDSPARVAIVGAGLVGAELANDLALGGHAVTLLDVADRPLAGCATAAQSAALLKAWAELPIEFVACAAVTRLEAIDGAKRLTTASGLVITADHVVVAAGLQTPSRLARSAGLAWNNGIDVQPLSLATNVPGIHALGDCIAIRGSVSRYIEPIGRQAQTLAATITGREAVAYQARAVPLRVKTSSMPFTV